jgi:hypothetical protein
MGVDTFPNGSKTQPLLAKGLTPAGQKAVLPPARPGGVGVVIAHLGLLAAQRLSGGLFQDTQI